MILVCDLGTSYFKLAMVDPSGQLAGLCRIRPPVRQPEPGWMELDARAFVEVLADGVAQLEAEVPGSVSAVTAVTFATQTNSFVLLDEGGRPLTPIVLWPDERAAAFEQEYRGRCLLPAAALTTGIPAVTRQYMAAKLLWLQRESPHTWEKTAKICLISDYLTLVLTGRHVTEAGAAGLTGLLDVHRCRWSAELLASLGIRPDCMPTPVRAGTELGPLDRCEGFGGPTGRLRLSPSCRFVVGCLDQYAGAIGAGNTSAGCVSETTGTVLASVRCADRFDSSVRPGTFQGPAFADGLYYRMAFGEIAANYLEWYRQQLPQAIDFERLAEMADRMEPGAGGLRLKSGVALTANRETLKLEDVFEGLRADHTEGHMVRCIMEAVAFALGEQIRALCGDDLPTEIRSAGGGARSAVWLQIKADVLGVPVAATECAEPTCLGAAILAEAACEGKSVGEVAQDWVRVKSPHLPRLEHHRRYQAMREDWTYGSSGRAGGAAI